MIVHAPNLTPWNSKCCVDGSTYAVVKPFMQSPMHKASAASIANMAIMKSMVKNK